MARYLETGEGRLVGKRIEVTALHRDGHEFSAELTIWPVGSGDSIHFSALIHDITLRKQLELQLQHQAFHDSLTGLANRALFRDRVAHALARQARGHGAVSVLFSDLDDFKTVNDSLGHDAGDQLLVAVAERLRAVMRPEDTTARFGGDEFAILLEETTEDGTRRAAERILEALRSPFEFHGRQVVMHASIGAAVTVGQPDRAGRPAAPGRPGDVQRQDVAARVASPSTSRRCTPRRSRAWSSRPTWSVRSRPATSSCTTSRSSTCASGRVTGVEALLRWRHAERGLVLPAEFIPIAEETGLIVPLGSWVVDAACQQLAAWGRAGSRRGPLLDRMSMWVNISARQLQEPDFVGDGGGRPARERDPAATGSRWRSPRAPDGRPRPERGHPASAARRSGVRLAIDDFGTGYSSLSYLERLPVEVLKIDRSFTAAIGHGRDVPVLVRSIVKLGQTLHMEVLAEGIETAEQLARLRAIDCRLGQGFHFSPALPADEVVELLDRAWPSSLTA